MIKKLIVGSGFSASMVNSMLKSKTKIFSIKNIYKLNRYDFIRRKNLDCNKFFFKKSISFGSIKFLLKRSKFHDRPINGGHSNVWGGHINLKKLPKKIIKFIREKNLFIQKLSYSTTGTISSSKYLAQLQNSSGKIFKSNDLLDNIENAIILDLLFIKKKIFVNVLFLNNLKKKKNRG